MKSASESYKQAGVDITAGYRAVELMKKHVSRAAIPGVLEGITSPDGRVFGRMAHAERTGAQLYKNVPGNQDSGIFRGAVDYFRD